MKGALVEKINLYQLFLLIVIFQIGSSVVVGIARDAGRDAWLAIALATVIGVLLIRMYVYIVSISPGKSLFEIIGMLMGRTLGIILAGVYSLYFFYIASRVLRDFMELIITDLFPNTPIEILAIVFMITVIYIVYLGPEVLARVTEIFFPYIFIFLIVSGIFLLVSGNVRLSRLEPLLADGFGPVFEALFPGLITFPFGEAIVLTMFITAVTKFQHAAKVSMSAVVITGITLIVIKTAKLSVLGVATTTRATFPILTAAREIGFMEFIERIDPIVIFIMMLGVLIKVCVFFFGGLKGLEYIFQLPYRHFSMPIGIMIAVASIFVASNYTEHIEEGLKFVPLHMHLPMQIGIPFLLTLLVFLKKRQKGGDIDVQEMV